MTSRINVTNDEIYFIRNQKQPADICESISNALLHPLRVVGGHTVKVIGPNQFEDFPSASLIHKIMVAIFFIVLFPISVPLLLAGYRIIKYSKTHAETCEAYHLFRKSHSSDKQLDPKKCQEAEQRVQSLLKDAKDLTRDNVAVRIQIKVQVSLLEQPEVIRLIQQKGQDPANLAWLIQIFSTLVNCSEVDSKVLKASREVLEAQLKRSASLSFDVKALTPYQMTVFLQHFETTGTVAAWAESILSNPDLDLEMRKMILTVLVKKSEDSGAAERALNDMKTLVPKLSNPEQEGMRDCLKDLIRAGDLSVLLRMDIYLLLRHFHWQTPDLFSEFIVPGLRLESEDTQEKVYDEFFQTIATEELKDYIKRDPSHMTIYIKKSQQPPLNTANLVEACKTFVEHHDEKQQIAPLINAMASLSGKTLVRYLWMMLATMPQFACLLNGLAAKNELTVMEKLFRQLIQGPLTEQFYQLLSAHAIFYIFQYAVLNKNQENPFFYGIKSCSPVVIEGFKTISSLQTEKGPKLRAAFRGFIEAYGSVFFKDNESKDAKDLSVTLNLFFKMMDEIYLGFDESSKKIFSESYKNTKEMAITGLNEGKIHSLELVMHCKGGDWNDDEQKLLMTKIDTPTLVQVILFMKFETQVNIFKNHFKLHSNHQKLLEILKGLFSAEHRQKLAEALK